MARRRSPITKVGQWLGLVVLLSALSGASYVYIKWLVRIRRYNRLIEEIAPKHGMDKFLVKAVMRQESGFDPFARSKTGAVGLMQIMPSTASLFGLDASIPEENVTAGTLYLKYLMEKYRKSRDFLRRVIAAYNAGPTAVDKHRGVPPYKETRTYVARVLAFLREFRKDPV